MRLVFLGSPTASVPALQKLVAAGHHVELVVTRADRRRQRRGQLEPTPVKAAARSLGLRVSHAVSDVATVEADFGIVVAFGRLISAATLAQLPMLNAHFSLLPRWRGAAPVERAILAGDEVTGVCVMGLEETLDTGPIYARATTSIDDKRVTALLAELADMGGDLLVDLLRSSGLPVPEAQHGDATYAEKMTPADFELDPSQSIEHLLRVVRLERAVTWVEGRRLQVLDATARPTSSGTVGTIRGGDDVSLVANDGDLVLRLVKPDSANSMSAEDWWRGSRLGDADARWGRVSELR